MRWTLMRRRGSSAVAVVPLIGPVKRVTLIRALLSRRGHLVEPFARERDVARESATRGWTLFTTPNRDRGRICGCARLVSCCRLCASRPVLVAVCPLAARPSGFATGLERCGGMPWRHHVGVAKANPVPGLSAKEVFRSNIALGVGVSIKEAQSAYTEARHVAKAHRG